jgi:hypothetical protein
MPVFEVAIPDQQLARMREALSPGQYRQASYQAVKRTTRKVARAVQDEVKRRTFIKPKYVKRVVTARDPQGDVPVGVVRISQEWLPAIAYKVSGGKRSGIRIQVSRDRAPVTLRHAFRATLKSGHVGIFARAKHLPTKGANQGKGRLTPRGFAGRFAIAEEPGRASCRSSSCPRSCGRSPSTPPPSCSSRPTANWTGS